MSRCLGCCTKSPSCTGFALKIAFASKLHSLHQNYEPLQRARFEPKVQIETCVTFCGMVWLRAAVIAAHRPYLRAGVSKPATCPRPAL
jgi:hypothetical protein